MFSDPTVANLLCVIARTTCLARRESATQRWQGALFPWESARHRQGTPNCHHRRVPGSQKSPRAGEHHLVADIRLGRLLQYWRTTGDESFIAHEGMALLLETAKFWISRAVRVNDRLEIHDVIGPDELSNMSIITPSPAIWRTDVQQALNIARQFGCSDDAFLFIVQKCSKELLCQKLRARRRFAAGSFVYG
ncbi:hypothetical protein ACNKHM_28635 [Shigella sonnei]